MFFFSIFSGVVCLLVSFSVFYWLRRVSGLGEHETTLIELVEKCSMSFLTRVVRHFLVSVAVLIIGIVAYKTFVGESHTILLPAGIFLGIVMCILSELVLTKYLFTAFRAALIRFKEDTLSGRRIALLGSLGCGFWYSGIALVGLSLWFLLISRVLDAASLMDFFNFLPSFMRSSLHINNHVSFRTIEGIVLIMAPSFSAALYALFSRISTGIFAKSADMSSDITGRTEYDLPEDDLRNPAVMADISGDFLNMMSIGTVLFQTLLFGCCVTAVIGLLKHLDLSVHTFHDIYPILKQPLECVAIGAIACLFIFPMLAYRFVVNKMGVVIPVISAVAVLLSWVLPLHLMRAMSAGLFLNILLLGGVVLLTFPMSPVLKRISASYRVHAINGFFSGMGHAALAMIIPVCGIALVFWSQIPLFKQPALVLSGLHHLGVMSVAMMSLFPAMIMLGGFAPLADGIRGFSEMLCYPEHLRKEAAVNDFHGTFCGALIKSFLSSSSVFIGLLLIVIYLYRLYFFLGMHLGMIMSDVTPHQLALLFDLNVYRASIWTGLFLGGLACFIVMGLIIFGVQKTSQKMTEEIRSQLTIHEGIWSGARLPDYQQIVTTSAPIATRMASWILLMAIVLPFLTTVFFKVNGSAGLMLGGIVFAFLFGTFFNYCGSAWRGAKKLIEVEGGIQSTEYVGAVFTDSIGDIFKDAFAPSFSILVNVIAFVTLLAGACIFYGL